MANMVLKLCRLINSPPIFNWSIIFTLPSTLNPPLRLVVPTTLRFPPTFKELEIFILPFTSTVSLTSVIKFKDVPSESVENDNVAIFDVANPDSLQKVNAFVGAIADKEYLQPDAAMHQLAMRLETIGLRYTVPKIEGNNGKSVVEVSQFGGRYGKTSDNTTSGDGDIENGDGTVSYTHLTLPTSDLV